MKEQLIPGATPVGLPEGQRPAGIEAGGGGGLTANGEPLSGAGAGLPFLGSGSEAGAAAEWRLKAAGVEFVEGTKEVGGGGDDPVEDYFKRVKIDVIQNWITEQQAKGLLDEKDIQLPDDTKIQFGEYKKIAVAVQAGAGSGRPIEEIIREVRRPATTPPEPQAAIRLAGWRDKLSADQRQRLRDKEQRWNQLQPAQLVAMQEKIAVALSNWGLGIEWPDELKKAGVLPEDGKVILRALDEAVKNSNAEVLKQRIDMALQLLPEAADHIQRLQKELGLSSREAVIARLAADLQTAVSIGRNTDVRLFPPKLKHILIQLIKSGNGTVS